MNDIKKQFFIFIAGMAMLIVALIISAGVALHQLKQEYNEVFGRAKVQTQLHAKYSNLLHEMWIRNPQFVELCLAECESFKEIQEIKQGDFEDEFIFWNKQDSIEYYRNGGTYGELNYLYY